MGGGRDEGVGSGRAGTVGAAAGPREAAFDRSTKRGRRGNRGPRFGRYHSRDHSRLRHMRRTDDVIRNRVPEVCTFRGGRGTQHNISPSEMRGGRSAHADINRSPAAVGKLVVKTYGPEQLLHRRKHDVAADLGDAVAIRTGDQREALHVAGGNNDLDVAGEDPVPLLRASFEEGYFEGAADIRRHRRWWAFGCRLRRVGFGNGRDDGGGVVLLGLSR